MRDTIEMAREAGFEITVDPTETPWRTFVEGWDDQLKAFEALVIAQAVEAEREACAKVCETLLWPPSRDFKLCAAAIRARGKA
jgi:hypothetical protein